VGRGTDRVPVLTGNHRDYRQAETDKEHVVGTLLVLLASGSIGALVVLLFVQSAELRRVRALWAVDRAMLRAVRERNRGDYGEGVK
jgi:hypothetical protein